MNHNHEIDALLRSAAEEKPLPASFRSEVWTRIAYAEQRSFVACLGKLFAAITRPVPAVASVTMMAIIGAWLGFATAPGGKDPSLSYAVSVSPFLQEHAP